MFHKMKFHEVGIANHDQIIGRILKMCFSSLDVNTNLVHKHFHAIRLSNELPQYLNRSL